MNNICKFCNKTLSNYKSKWRHEQTCKSKENNDVQIKLLQKEVINLKTKIKNMNNNKIINNNNTTNNTQNIIYVYPFGKEPTDVLSLDHIEKSLEEHGVNSVIDIVKKKHFNPTLPECHNFCVSAKNDQYACIVDPETKRIKHVNKRDIFDKVYTGVVSNVNSIDKNNEDIKETINKINNIPVSKKMLKILHLGINEEAYHNRELVKKTWKSANFDNEKIIFDLNNVSDDSDDENINNQYYINKIQKLINNIKNYKII
jgi:hypothetical protein